MELRTKRLVLRPFAAGDLDTLLAIRNAPEVIRTTDTGEPLPRERMERQLRHRLELWRERGLGSWLILLEGVRSASSRSHRSARAAASTPRGSSSASSFIPNTGGEG